MVGIDVVHMNWHRESSPAYQHRKYLERISSAAERRWVLDSGRPDAALWQLWAAKEATYKALCSAAGAPVFRPAQISVHWQSRPANSGEGHWDSRRARVSAAWTGSCAYAIAVRTCALPLALEHAIFPVREILAIPQRRAATSTEHSVAARELTAYLLKRIGVARAEITRTEGGRPYLADQPNVSVSWSHDGDWVAAIVAIQGGSR